MYFENSKSSLYFIIDGYLERDEDFFPDKETQLNTYDCWISYNPDINDDDNTFVFPGIYLTTWMPELINNFKALLEGDINEFDFNMFLYDYLDYELELPIYDVNSFDITIKFRKVGVEMFSAEIIFDGESDECELPDDLLYYIDDIDLKTTILLLTEYNEKFPYRPVDNNS